MGGQPLVTACMFCLLCATQSHCSSHHDAATSSHRPQPSSPPPPDNEASHLVQTYHPQHMYRRGRVKRDLDDDFIKLVFKEFGDGEVMTRQGFVKLLDTLGLPQGHQEPEDLMIDHKNSTNTSDHLHSHGDCKTGIELLGDSEKVTAEQYSQLCPAILHQLLPGPDGLPRCHFHSHHENNVSTNQAAVWFYSTLSVCLISLCGLLAVAVIPLMHKTIYHSMLQYLVALAVGTLCGDALLHLLPHAMMSVHAHGHHPSSHKHSSEDQHEINLWRGLAAALSLSFFYFMEKCLSFLAKWRKTNAQKHKVNTKVRVMRDENVQNDSGSSTRVGEKLCKHKYSSYPYCYGEITNNTHGHQHGGNGDPEVNNVNKKADESNNSTVKNIIHETDREDVAEKQLLENSGEPTTQETYTTIILREHDNVHHGHAHTHGHVHSAPGSLSSVAWMVVMGDGLHNFTDGLAIGAAFAANIGGGVSTAVAVFCHELPHELGDFAVLLKAGMSAKQAVFYNMLSSVLCLVGMCIGVLLGHNDTTTLWVFSAAAGMFLYIALVDMIPELTSNHSEKGTLCQCLLQVSGILTGIGIMLVIALYEHNLKEAFKNSL